MAGAAENPDEWKRTVLGLSAGVGLLYFLAYNASVLAERRVLLHVAPVLYLAHLLARDVTADRESATVRFGLYGLHAAVGAMVVEALLVVGLEFALGSFEALSWYRRRWLAAASWPLYLLVYTALTVPAASIAAILGRSIRTHLVSSRS